MMPAFDNNSRSFYPIETLECFMRKFPIGILKQ